MRFDPIADVPPKVLVSASHPLASRRSVRLGALADVVVDLPPMDADAIREVLHRRYGAPLDEAVIPALTTALGPLAGIPGSVLATADALERPDFVDAHVNRGTALLELKRPGDALASFERAIALRPEHAEAHFERGLALNALNRPGDALAAFERTIALKPDHAAAHTNRGNALADLGRHAEALAHAQ